jgi:predicted  nucleic acid-binding Zn-ribbon protein
VDQLKRLILLQKAFEKSCETESEIRELEETLEKMEACVRFNEAMKRKAQLEQAIHDLKAAIRQKQLDVATAREREKERQALLERATAPRELQALETQLKAAQKYREATEAEYLQMEETLEGLARDLKALVQELPFLEEEAAKERSAAEERLAHLRNQRALLQQEMEKVRTAIESSALREFDRLVNCRGGTAVVALIDESKCGGCGLALPILVVERIADYELVQCECCGRFIVHEEIFQSTALVPGN